MCDRSDWNNYYVQQFITFYNHFGPFYDAIMDNARGING